MKRFQRHRNLRPIHRGVSLLEVMIAIGVTSIGLLGVLALIPLAGHQARQGQILDRSAVIGESALSEMRTRGMLNYLNWRTANNTRPFANLGTFTPQAICIDPRGVAFASTPVPVETTFPLTVLNAGTPTMPRLSLDSGGGGRMDSLMADFVFQSQDDLSLEEAERDRTLPPYQLWAPNDSQINPTATPTRRQFSGSMSWMATIVPYGDTRFRVSVAVFSQRVLGDEVNALANFQSGGIAGGDVELQFASPAAAEVKLSEGSWILLSGRRQVGSQNNPSFVPVFHWYRVLMVDRDVQDLARMHVTLAGPDWDTANTEDVQATIIPGTVNVYERIMPLELSNLWANPN